MIKLPTVSRHADAEKYLQLCEGGRMSVIREVVSGSMETVLVSASGAPQAVVGKNYKHMFDQFVDVNGHGDGLFEGFHQTAGR